MLHAVFRENDNEGRKPQIEKFTSNMLKILKHKVAVNRPNFEEVTITSGYDVRFRLDGQFLHQKNNVTVGIFFITSFILSCF